MTYSTPRRRAVSTERRALAALEFAVACPLLVIMLGGAADYGLAQYYRSNLAFAMEAGAEYAYLKGSAVTNANIQSVITDAMNLPAGASANLSFTFTPSSAPGYYCVTVTGGVPALTNSTSGASCTDGTTAGLYIKVQATYTNTGIMSGFMATLSQPITETVLVRVK